MGQRVLLVDDHTIVREGLRSLLEQQLGFEVVGETGDGVAAVQLAGQLSPDLVIMDIAMPLLNGIDAAGQILAANPASRIIALSVHTEAEYVLAAFQAGFRGYLVKDCAFDELQFAIRAISQDQMYLSPSVAHLVLGQSGTAAKDFESSPFNVLTAREREVLQLIVEGRTTKEVAADLHLSPKTVETHRQRIMEKLDIDNLPALTKYAIREGLTSLGGG